MIATNRYKTFHGTARIGRFFGTVGPRINFTSNKKNLTVFAEVLAFMIKVYYWRFWRRVRVILDNLLGTKINYFNFYLQLVVKFLIEISHVYRRATVKN